MSTQRLLIERLSYSADGIAHLENGKTVFVKGVAPGDIVEAEIIEEKKGFARAKLSSVLESGGNRVESPCPYRDICGGCPWSQVSYEAQLTAKRDNLCNALQRIGHFGEDVISRVSPTIESPKQWGYRNKVEFEVNTDKGFQLGLHGEDGAFVAVKSCMLLDKKLQKAPESLRGSLAYALKGNDAGIMRIGLRQSLACASQEIALWTESGPFPRGTANQVLNSAVAGCSSIVRVMLKNNSKTKARELNKVEVLSGKGFWTERIRSYKYLISAPSFFQVNTQAAAILQKLVTDAFEHCPKDRAFDLYSGAGTFTLPLADMFDEVIAVESYGSSVRDLRRNLEDSQLYANVLGGDVARELPGLGHADAAVIDPPRAGLAVEVIDSLCESGVEKLAYVSCDPSTLARDLEMLCKESFAIESICPVDLFPQTYHCESVVVLKRK